MEGEGKARSSAASEDHGSTSFPLASRSSSSPGPSPGAAWNHLNQGAIWEDASHFLLSSQDRSSTSFPLAPRSSGSPGPSAVAPWMELNRCATWDEARLFLLSCQVPEAQLPKWDALWHWDQMKALVTSAGGGDSAVLDQLVTDFCQRVEGTREDYKCLVPERDGRKGLWCLKVVCRRDRMRSHMCSDHLDGMGGYECNGQCENADCRETFLQPRYLDQHVNPTKVACSRCGRVFHKRNLSTHRC